MQIVLTSEDGDALQQTSNAVIRDLRTLQGIGNITSSASLQRPEIQIVPDYAQAADLGITAQTLASFVQFATSGDFATQLPKLNLPQRQIPIRVRLAEYVRKNLELIRQLQIPSSRGLIALDSVANINMGSIPHRSTV